MLTKLRCWKKILATNRHRGTREVPEQLVQRSFLMRRIVSCLGLLLTFSTALRAQTLLNVDLGSGASSSSKTGPAATGVASTDFWNWYNRDTGGGGVSNLKYSDG